MDSARLRRGGVLFALTVVYYLAGRFGLSLATVHQSATAVWPPTGIALAACLFLGTRVWPAIFAGAFLVNITTSHSVPASLLIASGNTLEALSGAWLVRRTGGGVEAFETAPGILAYAVSVVAASTIAATIGVAALLMTGLASRTDAVLIWLTWWLGDASGALIITPAIAFWIRTFAKWTWQKIAAAALALIVIVSITYTIFAGSIAARRLPLGFLIFPSLLWIALRFGPRETATAIIVISGIAVRGTIHGFGPFARNGANESMLLLQAFLGVTSVAALALASETARRRSSEAEVRRFNDELTARVEARTEDLERLHGRLVEAQHVAHIGSWEWDVPSNVVWWSEEMYRMYGLEVGTPVNYETFLDRVHPEDRPAIHATIWRSLQTNDPFSFEHRIVRPDGSVRVLSAHGRVATDQQGGVVRMMGIGHDVTDRKKAEEERMELLREQGARREAEEASRIKDQFLATLSHELRTPLNAILGWAQLLRDAGNDRLRQKAIDAIMRNVSIQAQLVSDILDVARIRSGTLQIEPQALSLTDVISGALDIIKPLLTTKNIQVSVSIAPQAEVVSADPQRLRQVFWNLLSNAAKFTSERGHVAVAADVTGDGIQITVTDDGPGIDEEFLPHVFEEFRQADGSLTRKYGGLGLGLAISHHLIRLHNGTITAGNRPEGGAVFTVNLPAAAAATHEV